jgi:ABC-type transport system involved in multi-copper enzyme maturation permease subunit
VSSLAIPRPGASHWELWRSQASSILGVELRKNFITKRGFWIYLLALAPAAIIWLHSLVMLRRPEMSHPLSKDTEILAGIFQIFFLRPAVYFGCVGIFTYLFRGEVVERTLHYYFLSPVKREVLIAGKYLAGLITSAFFFCGSIVLCFTGMYAHFAGYEIRAFMMDGPGVAHLLGYVGVTFLACMAYGALFLWLGIRYKNPVIPAVTLLFWESFNIFLPSWLKKISILYYLRSLAPVETSLSGPGALIGSVAEPASAPVALVSLVAITGVLLVLAVKELQRAEISYSSD